MKESVRAAAAWADYLALGDDRSLPLLVQRYQGRTGAVPTRQLSRLKAWSSAFDWQGRLKRLADEATAAAEAAYQARRRQIMGSGLALDHERVEALKLLAEELFGDFQAWVTTVKLAANGEKVEVEEFNASELRELRGLFDDLAKETGGRQSKVDITTAGQPLKGYVGIDPEAV